MTTDQLKCFIAAYKYESFRLAADHLYLHPTSVGRHIASLEQELGVSLFKRHHRTIKNTRAGEIFYQGAESALNSLRDTLNSLRNLQRGSDNKFSVRILEDTYSYLAQYITEFFSAHPNVNFSIDSYVPINGADICRQLSSGEFDLVFGYDDVIPVFSAGYEWRKIVSLPVQLVAGKNHPLASRKVISLADLQRAYIFSGDFHNPALEDTLVASMRAKNLTLPVFSEPFSRNDMLLHVSSGHGVSFLVPAEKICELWDCVPLEIRDFSFEKPLYAIWHSSNRSPMLKAFLQLIPEDLP